MTNIGFTLENTPKLPPHSGVKPITVTHGLVGTPMYLSPEAVANDAPDAPFDL